jgi:hypothetical protein
MRMIESHISVQLKDGLASPAFHPMPTTLHLSDSTRVAPSGIVICS